MVITLDTIQSQSTGAMILSKSVKEAAPPKSVEKGKEKKHFFAWGPSPKKKHEIKHNC